MRVGASANVTCNDAPVGNTAYRVNYFSFKVITIKLFMIICNYNIIVLYICFVI
nr:MAG TPA: hypothetical protein [Caudoviricetes sp.]